MNETNFLELDGRILRTFLVVLEESSVSRAADRLNVTQSAVSHTLAKLRPLLGDPLFVRSGQGFTPTETALSLKEPVQRALDGLKALTDQRHFDPRSEEMHFTIAANDMQRELIFPVILRTQRARGIRLTFEFIPSGVPNVTMLRDARCDLVLTPLPPDAPDIFQRRILTGRMMSYFDGAMRRPPRDWAEYCEAEHVVVRFPSGRGSSEVLRGVDQSKIRPPTVTVPNFHAIPSFIEGSTLISTDMDLLQLGPLKDLSTAPLPFETEPVSIYLVWHQRSSNDPAHLWLRQQVENAAARIPGRLEELERSRQLGADTG